VRATAKKAPMSSAPVTAGTRQDDRRGQGRARLTRCGQVDGRGQIACGRGDGGSHTEVNGRRGDGADRMSRADVVRHVETGLRKANVSVGDARAEEMPSRGPGHKVSLRRSGQLSNPELRVNVCEMRSRYRTCVNLTSGRHIASRVILDEPRAVYTTCAVPRELVRSVAQSRRDDASSDGNARDRLR
jgi:hypothetical protein